MSLLLAAVSVGLSWITLQPSLAALLDAQRRLGPETSGPQLAARVQALLPAWLALDLVVVGLLTYVVIQLAIGRPLQKAEAVVERISRLEPDVTLGDGGPILARLQRALSRMADSVTRERANNQRQLEELAQANARLLRAQTELVASDRLATVGKLAAGVAHEVGNPLSGILGYLSLLRSRAKDAPETLDLLARVEHEVKRIDQIVRSLLELGRPSRRAAGPTLLRPIVDGCVGLLGAGAEFRGVQVEVQVPDDLAVRTEPGPLSQVLVNLLLNAAQAMQGQGRVTVRAAEAGEHVEVSVVDTGPGLPPEVLPRLFEPFFTTKEAGTGTGLGLAVSRHLASTQGGALEGANGPAGGAVFTLRLPRA